MIMIFPAPPFDKVERSDQPEIWRKSWGLSSGDDNDDKEEEEKEDIVENLENRKSAIKYFESLNLQVAPGFPQSLSSKIQSRKHFLFLD